MRDLASLHPLADKAVLVRIDTDIDVVHGEVVDDYRLKAALPTIRYLIDRGSTLTLIGHRDRPAGQVVPELRLKPAAHRLAHLLVPQAYPTVVQQPAASPVLATSYRLNKKVQLYENLRFDAGEEANEPEFARLLAAGHDYYVNESFAAVHRRAASTVGIGKLLPSAAGLRLIDELAHLDLINQSPKRPLTLIVGGAKLKEKLGLLASLLPKVDHVLTGGVVANLLLQVKGVDIKQSKIEKEWLPAAERLLASSGGKNPAGPASAKIILPLDYVWHNDKIVDLGVATLVTYAQLIEQSQTIFWAGSLGLAEDHRFAAATQQVAQQLARHSGIRMVGGGDTVAALERFHLLHRMSFVSTGGGAALEYLAGRQLPGLTVL